MAIKREPEPGDEAKIFDYGAFKQEAITGLRSGKALEAAINRITVWSKELFDKIKFIKKRI